MINKEDILINENITADKVFLVDDESKELVELSKAIQLAKSRHLDLVQIAVNKDNTVICKILDFNKYVYQLNKKDKDNKKKQKVLDLKEIKMRPKIDIHDFDFKLKAIKEFLTKGHRTKVSVYFRGREIAYLDQGKKLLERVIESCKDIAKCDSGIQQEETRMSIMLSSK